MRAAFRVDASSEMGTGHLARCMSLGAALLELGWEVRYVVRRLDEVAWRLLAEASAGMVCWLDQPSRSLGEMQGKAPRHLAWAGVSASKDAEDTIVSLRGFRPDWVIVDHYAFDAEWHEYVGRALNCKIGAIDDLADRTLQVHMIIDQNWDSDHEEKYNGRLPAHAIRLFGPRYAMLSEAYRRGKVYLYSEFVNSIGIFLGGVDRQNYTLLAARACIEVLGFRGAVEIATRTQNPNLTALEEFCARNPNVALLLDQPNLAEFFARHDLQIGAGGGATWERCRIGVPSVLISFAENQDVVTDVVERLGVAKKVSLATLEGIAEAVRSGVEDAPGRRRMCINGSRLVDGWGCLRIGLIMSKDQVVMHRATAGDAELAFSWRNDESTRRYFRDPSPIEHGSHIEWWRTSLGRSDRIILMARVGKLAVGVVWFNLTTSGEAEVSVYLAPQFTGLGLGAKILVASSKWMREEVRGVRKILADVHPDNFKSVKAFQAAGFARRSGREWVLEAA